MQHVDYENSCVCGYLKIQGLTEVYVQYHNIKLQYNTQIYLFYKQYLDCPSSKVSTVLVVSYLLLSLLPSHLKDYPNLTTFFEGEIISRRHPFLTRKWDASEEVDRKHWGKFAPFRPFMKTFNSDDFSYDQIRGTDYVFMRWKVSPTGLHIQSQ